MRIFSRTKQNSAALYVFNHELNFFAEAIFRCASELKYRFFWVAVALRKFHAIFKEKVFLYVLENSPMSFENRDAWTRATESTAGVAEVDAGLRAYMLRVYNYMASGVALTGIVAWLVAHTGLQGVFFHPTPAGMQPGMLAWAAMLVSIGMVFSCPLRWQRCRRRRHKRCFGRMRPSTVSGCRASFSAIPTPRLCVCSLSPQHLSRA